MQNINLASKCNPNARYKVFDCYFAPERLLTIENRGPQSVYHLVGCKFLCFERNNLLTEKVQLFVHGLYEPEQIIKCVSMREGACRLLFLLRGYILHITGNCIFCNRSNLGRFGTGKRWSGRELRLLVSSRESGSNRDFLDGNAGHLGHRGACSGSHRSGNRPRLGGHSGVARNSRAACHARSWHSVE
jgi:hypothetical protein